MRRFWLGVLATLVTGAVGVLAFLGLGLMPVSADAKPGAFESWLAGFARDAAIERRGAGSGAFDPRQANELTYLDAVIKETARLHPITDGVARLLKKPTRLGRLDLLAGAGASPSTYLVHRHPDLWPEPEQFRPERFVGARPSLYTFFPFGGVSGAASVLPSQRTR